ncbi:uncharacterized protein CDV56_101028 [Aspergillus thermomutatus]|uniref:Uncharacterized protein n=1 Tax=Aspergillus thermomutatus TaxID=41047 RepID=A0A397G0L5_ASPTH|nr:uncharacterized protein CDV56_101028 [Aspergillus thermomutatus]RHZ44267.1 hypothetical protein CDV56_101028 [Aspergillus thermomutatus]
MREAIGTQKGKTNHRREFTGPRFTSKISGDAYVGIDIAKGHETSDTYGVTLTNGKDGNVVFAIYNMQYSDAWILNSDTYYNAMIAPLGNHAKCDVSLGKRDNCWGSKHNDYEGSYYKVGKIGAFGSEVYASN